MQNAREKLPKWRAAVVEWWRNACVRSSIILLRSLFKSFLARCSTELRQFQYLCVEVAIVILSMRIAPASGPTLASTRCTSSVIVARLNCLRCWIADRAWTRRWNAIKQENFLTDKKDLNAHRGFFAEDVSQTQSWEVAGFLRAKVSRLLQCVYLGICSRSGMVNFEVWDARMYL